MTTYTEKQLRNIGLAALTGAPSNDPESADLKASRDEIARLQAEAQARINKGRKLGLMLGGRRPGPGESLGVAP